MLIPFAIGGCLSWFLVLPAAIVTVIGTTLRQSRTSNDSAAVTKTLLKTPYIIPIFLVVLASLIELFIMLTSHSPGSVSFSYGINMPGVTIYYGAGFYLLLFFGLLAFAYNSHKINPEYLKNILWMIIPLLIFCSFIFTFQIMTAGEIGYYFFKVLNLTIITAVPLCIVGFSLLIDSFHRKKKQLLEITILFVLLLLCINFLMLHILLIDFFGSFLGLIHL